MRPFENVLSIFYANIPHTFTNDILSLVKYWDTTKSQPPRVVGQIRGTPTIKFVYPSPKNKRNSNKKKVITDYNGEREWRPLMEYATSRMPNFVKRINGAKGLDDFVATADKYALPKVLIFSKQTKTSHVLKSLSSAYRRRVLIGEVRGSKNNAEIVAKFGVDAFPRVMILDDEGEVKSVMTKKPSWNRLNSFLHEYALKKPYFEDEIAMAKLAQNKKEEL